MKAIIYTEYGPPDVLELKEIEKPVPKENEILVKVHATTVTTGDTRLRSLNVPPGFRFITRLAFGFRKPRNPVLGQELSGEVESTGEEVKLFKKGDKVYGASGSGGYAGYATVAEDDAIVLKPNALDYEEAASLTFGSLSSLVYLRDFGKIKSGDKVLINGASGGLGTFAVQLSKHFGAEVTGVCSSSNAVLVKSLGADKVIDYTKEDFTQNGEKYDIIFDTVGKVTYTQCKDSLKENGRFLMAVAGIPQFLLVLWTSLFSRRKAVAGVAVFKKEDLNFIKELVEQGKLKPVIDRSYPFEQMVEAHRYVDKGHKKGSVVINLNSTKGVAMAGIIK